MVYDNLDVNKVETVQKRVEDSSRTVDGIVDDIVGKYSNELDNYVLFIKECLADGENPPTDTELDDWCLNLSTYIYFAGSMCEQLGIRDDISKAVYRETYNNYRSQVDKGTVADKDSLAELNSQQEMLTNICYNRAFKVMKSKVENAQELLSSCKKVSTRRMNEYQITHFSN